MDDNKENYSALLKHPLWQKKRLEILNRDNFTCSKCESKNKSLHVHHKNYQWGNKPWEYPDSNFITFCWECHGEEEYYKGEFNSLVHDLLLMGHTYQSLNKFFRDNLSTLTNG